MSRTLISKSDAATTRGTFLAEADGTITAGQVVAYDLGSSGDDRYRHVVAADADAVATAIVAGVALNAASDGDEVEVCYWGIVSNVACESTVAANDVVFLSSTAGRVTETFDLGGTVETDGVIDTFKQRVGTALTSASSNLCDVWVDVSRP